MNKEYAVILKNVSKIYNLKQKNKIPENLGFIKYLI